MKALSIRQPWAYLIANGFKDVENRTWMTKYRGDIVIHAGQIFDRNGYCWVRETFPEIELPAPRDFALGGIVGRAVLTDCVPPGSHLNGRCTSPWYMGAAGFLVRDGRPTPFVPMKGRLSFFDVNWPEVA